jgi:hypothetical protein
VVSRGAKGTKSTLKTDVQSDDQRPNGKKLPTLDGHPVRTEPGAGESQLINRSLVVEDVNDAVNELLGQTPVVLQLNVTDLGVGFT